MSECVLLDNKNDVEIKSNEIFILVCGHGGYEKFTNIVAVNNSFEIV